MDYPNVSGIALHLRLDDGRYVAVASGPDIKDDYSGDFEDIKGYARIVIHETLHCLHDLVRSDVGPDQLGWIISDLQYSKEAERFADVGSVELMMRNGDTNESALTLAASYDLTGVTSEGHIKYDNGDAFIRVAKEFGPEAPGLKDFRLCGWQETINRMNLLAAEEPITVKSITERYSNLDLFPSLEEKFKGEALRRAEELSPVHKNTEGVVDYFWHFSPELDTRI